jgi:hypothetical protein
VAAIVSARKDPPRSSTVRARSRLESETTRPNAERTPAALGQRTRVMSSSSAIRAACIGPAPPNATSA